METRPKLERYLDSKIFQSYYYLKEELTAFCRQEGLQSTGSKEELTKRIAAYLETGEKKVLKAGTKKSKASLGELIRETVIGEPFVCSEQHRAFFKAAIGRSFSFNVAFQKWLKGHAGQTYQDAIEAYYAILEEKKHTKTVIDKQFKYNTYIRAFFEDNPGRRLEEAIACWKYKKAKPGSHHYEKEDLKALDKQQ